MVCPIKSDAGQMVLRRLAAVTIAISADKSSPWLLKTIVSIGFWRMTLLLEFNIIRVSSRHAMVGVSVPQSQRAASVEDLPGMRENPALKPRRRTARTPGT